jgi:hypothetical protein
MLMAMVLRRASRRVYGDFLMPSRLNLYRALLERALAEGYEVISVERLWALIRSDRLDAAQRYLVLRNDIDTGPATAREMWQIERSLGIIGSYFFRLSSLDLRLMTEMANAGNEPSYHYEELATVAKQHRPRTKADLLRHVPEAQELFARNVAWLRSASGQPIRVVAAHGDFVNRKLGILSSAILADPAFRSQVGIELEVYDEACMNRVTSRHADLTSPPYWTPADPIGAIAARELVVYVLVHPRSWRVERGLNARDDALRIWQGLHYRLPTSRDQPARNSAR